MTRIEREVKIIEIAKWFVKNKATVRSAGKHFQITKSTIHKWLTKDLSDLNSSLYFDVSDILLTNFKERNVRGGEATKEKYRRLNKTSLSLLS